MSAAAKVAPLTAYEKFVVAMLAFLQFTIIIDFMILSPLGAFVMPALGISPQQFGIVVSAYAFAAGVSNFVAAGYADRFDRKKMLLFFYTGFMIGTLMCGLAPNFEILLIARIFTGIFGGVIGSIVMSIATDLFPMEKRGRVMGLIQTAFAASQVLGLPAGLYLSNHWDWHAPFLVIVAIGTVVGIVIAFVLRPINAHLALPQESNAFGRLWATLTEPRQLMPFGADFSVNNLKISIDDLPKIYLVTGVFMVFMGPLAGRAADRYGKYPVFLFGTMLTIVMVLYYTHLGETPLWAVMIINVLLFTGIFSRIVPSQALMSAVPEPRRRGAFMAVSGSLQQISGGAAAALAGAIVTRAPDGHLEHFEWLGYVITFAALITLAFMYAIHRQVPDPAAKP